jgi:large subunit ribosomal protein L17
MKHRKTGRQFGRVSSQRKALMFGLLSNLIINGRIHTTEAKAKETKNMIDKVITKAKRAKQSRMEMIRKLENDVSEKAVEILVNDITRFDSRVSGYARVIKFAPRRSDSARMAIVELVDRVKEQKVAKKEVKEVAAEKVEPQESK